MLHQNVLSLSVGLSSVVRAGSALFDLRQNALDPFHDRLYLAAALASDGHCIVEIPLELGDAGEKIMENLRPRVSH